MNHPQNHTHDKQLAPIDHRRTPSSPARFWGLGETSRPAKVLSEGRCLARGRQSANETLPAVVSKVAAGVRIIVREKCAV